MRLKKLSKSCTMLFNLSQIKQAVMKDQTWNTVKMLSKGHWIHLRWITATEERPVLNQPNPLKKVPLWALLLSDRHICSSLGYLISQLLCCARIPTLIARPVDKSSIQLLGQRHQQRDQVSALHTEIYSKRSFCGVGLFSWCCEQRKGTGRNI